MGAWETGIGFLWSVGFFSLIATLLVLIIVYYILVIVVKKNADREPKRYEKIIFFVVALIPASLIFIFSLGEGAALVTTYISIAFFLIVLFLLFMVLLTSFFGKPSWKFWKFEKEEQK